ncbi:GNAT family N-acetyltransferase [Bacillus salitolerans]|uniref:GNAT family N-acetyltransferase n=1 Tax=Bacillus salitolerans TaxID=1437434 RepID=A0ABW4LSU0_9BACI
MLHFKEFNKDTETEELVHFLIGDTWPFHGQVNPKEESIIKSLNDGFYTENGTRTFWMEQTDRKIGLIRLFDLEDPTCLFDIRLKEAWRQKGIGSKAVRWIADFAFRNYPELIRVEGHTRHDNVGMRKTFSNNGYVKEAYNRKSWPQEGVLFDSVSYAMIREDWKNGTTTPIHDLYTI